MALETERAANQRGEIKLRKSGKDKTTQKEQVQGNTEGTGVTGIIRTGPQEFKSSNPGTVIQSEPKLSITGMIKRNPECKSKKTSGLLRFRPALRKESPETMNL